MGQQEVLQYLQQHPNAYHSVKDIEAATGMHFTNVYECLDKLYTRGNVTIKHESNGTKKKLRTYKIVEKSQSPLQPLVEEYQKVRVQHMDLNADVIANLFLIHKLTEGENNATRSR